MSDEIPNGTVNQQALIDEVGRIHKQYSDAEFKTFADQMDEVGVKTAELCAQLQEANADVESLASTRDRDQARYRLAGLKTRQLVDRADDAMAELNTGVDLAVSLGVPEAAELEFVMTALGTDTEGYRGARFTLLTAAHRCAGAGDLRRSHAVQPRARLPRSAERAQHRDPRAARQRVDLRDPAPGARLRAAQAHRPGAGDPHPPQPRARSGDGPRGGQGHQAGDPWL